MSCQYCVARVKDLLMQQPGVLNVQINLDKGKATMEREPSTEVSRIAEVITEAGHPTKALTSIVVQLQLS